MNDFHERMLDRLWAPAMRLAYERGIYSKAAAWLKVRSLGQVCTPDGHVGVVRDHDWRKDHDDHHWAWYAVAIEGDGPDTWIAYDGTSRKGWRLDR